jgi:hypothetical protein
VKKEEIERISKKIDMELFLFSSIITVFVLIVTLKSSILVNNLFLTTQLVVSIPLLLNSVVSNITAQKGKDEESWKKHASFMFILGYAFLNNTIGIMIAMYVNKYLALIFFLINWLIMLSYSYLKVSLKHTQLIDRVKKDALFIGIQIVLGLIPVLSIH